MPGTESTQELRVPRGASSVCHTKPCGIVTHHPLGMQVKCYGSTTGFHPVSVGSTPITRTVPLWPSSYGTCFVNRYSRVQFSPEAPMLRKRTR